MKYFASAIFVIGILIPAYAFTGVQTSNNYQAPLVWIDDHGEGRNLHVMFRRTFTLQAMPEKGEAELNIFADSRYILYINGHSIHYGPARSYPANPVYDTYDLRPYLRTGENVIALMVRSNGTNTYQLPLSIGGCTAWGSIRDGIRTISLNTPGDWRVKRSEAWHQDAPKMSFAAGPIEMHDARYEWPGWTAPGFDDSSWDRPVPITNQSHWGSLRPRNIPFLTQDEYLPKTLMGKYALHHDEEIISFRVKSDDRTRRDFDTQKRVFAYTYIYSPEEQNVEVGTWWGEYFLNGEGPLPRHDTPIEVINRQRMVLELKPGWNFFFIKYDIVWASWEFYMAFPKDRGLILSPFRQTSDELAFMTAGPFTTEEEKRVLDIPLPFNGPEDLPISLSVGWEGRPRGNHANNPAWNIAWSHPETALAFEPYEINNLPIKAGEPTALMFDFRHKKLGRIFIEYDAPEGTQFDIAFSEDLIDGRPWVLKRAGIFTAAGHRAGNGSTRFETFKPYGLRYVQLNVTGHNSDVVIRRIGVVNQIYPFTLEGSFSSSDPMMDAIWQLGWRTLLVCAEDSYTDTPFRERGLYAGDALPQYAITLATSGDSQLIKRSLEIFQDFYISLFDDAPPHEGTPAQVGDFPLKTLEFFRWYVQMENDREFAERLYPQYQNLIEKYRALDTYQGLTIFPRVFIEWTRLHKTDAALTVANALLVRSYRNMAWLATYLGKDHEAVNYSGLADRLTADILAHCWDEAVGAFHDGFHQGEKINAHFPISSAYPVAFGLTNPSHDERLKPFFARVLADIGNIHRQRATTPYGGYYVLAALYKLEEAATAERFIRQYWSPMIIRHNDTAWENFDDGADGTGQGTLSHAWSGGPTFYMSTQVLGVPLLFPDFDTSGDTLIIAPQAESINRASGTVPTPHGPVTVSWHVHADMLFIEVDAPDGLAWHVRPKGRLAAKKLVVNGLKPR